MRSTLIVPGLVSLVASQLIELGDIANLDPVLVSAPLDVVQDTPPDVPAAPIEPITTPPSRVRRQLIQKRDGDCSPQPTGSGPVPSPDTVAAFQSFPTFQVGNLADGICPQLIMNRLWRLMLPPPMGILWSSITKMAH